MVQGSIFLVSKCIYRTKDSLQSTVSFWYAILSWHIFHVCNFIHLVKHNVLRNHICGECQNFPGNKIPGQKISRQNIPGWKILGPENSRNTYFSWNSRNFLWENSRILFFRGQKIPGFLAPLISRIENSVTEFPRTFLAIFLALLGKTRQNPARRVWIIP